MDKKEKDRKLREEISMLSRLISTSKPSPSSSTNYFVVSSSSNRGTGNSRGRGGGVRNRVLYPRHQFQYLSPRMETFRGRGRGGRGGHLIFSHKKRKSNRSLLSFSNSNPYVFRGAGRSCRISPRKISKSRVPGIVQIGGSKFIRKNNGRSLKRVKSKGSPGRTININGSQFITKNKGKTLKRLSKQSISSSLIRTPLSQNHGMVLHYHRMAQRAVSKSKLTLKERSWKKKRFCVYYNRLGECKKNDEGNCPYIHDRKQLTICPKFVVGKCSVPNCKLSHDLKIGRMPPCQFFNKSNCSRENCPYPHIKIALKRRKPSEENNLVREKEVDTTSKKDRVLRKKQTYKRKSSPRSNKSNRKTKSDQPKGEKAVNSRYYEQSPDSQPIVSIIPRRIRNEEQRVVDDSPVLCSSDAATNSTCLTKQDILKPDTKTESIQSPTTIRSLQRERLMSKVNRLQERVKAKESTAPHFLPFK